MQFNCLVSAAKFDEANDLWRLRLQNGRELTLPLPRHRGRTAVGADAAAHQRHGELRGSVVPHLLLAAGAGGTHRQASCGDRHRRDRRAGRSPRSPTGGRSHGIPAAAELVRAAQQRSDFRRRDGGHPRALRRNLRQVPAHPGGFEHEPDRRGFYEVSREERLALWDKLYAEPGFGIWLSNFREIFIDETANAEFSEYIANRIRAAREGSGGRREADSEGSRLRHPARADRDELLRGLQQAERAPRRHRRRRRSSASRRRAFARSKRDYDFDIIVYATGFDAITGSYDRIDIEGVGGAEAARQMADGPITYLGMQINGFPNLITIAGPQSGSASTNYPRGIEVGVDWATGLLNVRARTRLHAHGGNARGRATVERSRREDVRDDADAQSEGLVHRLQLQRRGPRAGSHSVFRLQRRRAEVSRDDHRRGRTGVSRASCSTGAPGGTTTRRQPRQRSRSSIERRDNRAMEKWLAVLDHRK